MTSTLKSGPFTCQAVTLNALIPYAPHQHVLPSPPPQTPFIFLHPHSPLMTSLPVLLKTKGKKKKKQREFIPPPYSLTSIYTAVLLLFLKHSRANLYLLDLLLVTWEHCSTACSSRLSVFCNLLKMPINIQTHYFLILKKKKVTHLLTLFPLSAFTPFQSYLYTLSVLFFSLLNLLRWNLHSHCTIIKTFPSSHTPWDFAPPTPESAQPEYPGPPFTLSPGLSPLLLKAANLADPPLALALPPGTSSFPPTVLTPPQHPGQSPSASFFSSLATLAPLGLSRIIKLDLNANNLQTHVSNSQLGISVWMAHSLHSNPKI